MTIQRHTYMTTVCKLECRTRPLILAGSILLLPFLAFGQSTIQKLPNTGQQVTPLSLRGARFQPLNPGLADNPQFTAGQAETTVVSPNGKTLLILTSGYNLLNYSSGPQLGNQNNNDSTEYVFIYDITNTLPVQRQVIKVPNTYAGIVFDPSGTAFYVAGGVDDNVHFYSLGQNGLWAEQPGSPVALSHTSANGLAVTPEAAGIAITQDGTKLVVANYYNDSVSILSKNGTSWTKTGELDLRPGKISSSDRGIPGGEYPFWVSVKGSSVAYVSSMRDREIVVVNLFGAPTVIRRIKVTGQPSKMTLNSAQTTLYVAEDETDSVAFIDTTANVLTREIGVSAPAGLLPVSRAQLTGNNTNSVTLTPDEKSLYVTNGNMNDIAVLDLTALNGPSPVIGLIPTGWYPNSVSFNSAGTYTYVVNGKSSTGPNAGFCHGDVLPRLSAASCNGSNQYDLQLVKAGFQSFPTPAPAQLTALSQQVADNNNFQRTESAADVSTMTFLRQHIQHVIYVIKENRTYDQILGDLPVGNGDPRLTEFPVAVTPNLHNLALNFVTLDNFYDTSEVSMDGWPWSTSARAPDVVEKQTTVNYAGRGVSYDSEGTNRNVNVSYPTIAERQQANPLNPSDPDLLPGTTDTAAPDGPNNAVNTGYLWDQALRAGLSVRNYGFFVDLTRYFLSGALAPYAIPKLIDPAATQTTVAYSANAGLRSLSDPYFRGFDQAFPDFYRFAEWNREFDANYSQGGLPALSLVRLAHDHTGSFSSSILGVNTPELQVADNDYAVGLLVQKIAGSRYASNTLIFIIEDDAQDGGDHVDAHRSTAFVVGPYVRQHALVSTSYNTVSMYRTMEDILGLTPANLNDSTAVPMTDVFDIRQLSWSYTAAPSALLYNTQLPLPLRGSAINVPKPTHNAEYWAAATNGLDFSSEDLLEGKGYNRILWKGLMGDKPYPAVSSGLDLRRNREELLTRFRESLARQ